MIIYGYAKGYRYNGDGTLSIRVRIPSIHGPYTQKEFNGRRYHNYVLDKDLPFYQSVLLPYVPGEGEIVMLSSVNESNQEWVVIGLTGGAYGRGLLDTE